jgi:hypothetical protein
MSGTDPLTHVIFSVS